MPKTRKNERGSATRGWKNQKPSYRQRSVMLKKCGKKCFLGTKKSFPICKKNTCNLLAPGCTFTIGGSPNIYGVA